MLLKSIIDQLLGTLVGGLYPGPEKLYSRLDAESIKSSSLTSCRSGKRRAWAII